MTRRSRLRPGTAPASRWGVTVNMPVGGGAAPCECDITGVTFVGGSTSATVEADQVVVFVAEGLICPDTVWSFDLDWTGETAPEITQQGAAAWSFTLPENGTLTITPSAVCNGVALAFDDLVASTDACSVDIVIQDGDIVGGCIEFPDCPPFVDVSSAVLEFDGDEIYLIVGFTSTDCIEYSQALEVDPFPPPIEGHADGDYVGTITVTHGSPESTITVVTTNITVITSP